MTIRPPAHIEVYVSVLGAPLAVEFFLTFGGGDLSIGRRPQPSSRLVRFLGMDKALALARHADRLPARVPIPKRWIAQYLVSEGYADEDIARRLHVSNVSVRRWLAGDGDDRQLRLL